MRGGGRQTFRSSVGICLGGALSVGWLPLPYLSTCTYVQHHRFILSNWGGNKSIECTKYRLKASDLWLEPQLSFGQVSQLSLKTNCRPQAEQQLLHPLRGGGGGGRLHPRLHLRLHPRVVPPEGLPADQPGGPVEPPHWRAEPGGAGGRLAEEGGPARDHPEGGNRPVRLLRLQQGGGGTSLPRSGAGHRAGENWTPNNCWAFFLEWKFQYFFSLTQGKQGCQTEIILVPGFFWK